MKLGILVTTDKHLDDVIGIVSSAVAKGNEVEIFSMDSGGKLLEKSEFTDLSSKSGVSMAYCDHSAKGLGVNTDGVPDAIVRGSQFNNANMMHDMDKVINL